jgi:hypothetical protein
MICKLKLNVPSCSKCKYSFKQQGHLACKLFKYVFVTTNDKETYADTETRRTNEKLCGKEGIYFKPR